MKFFRSLTKSVVGVTLVMNVDRYIVMKPLTPMNSIADRTTGANSFRSGAMSAFAHIDRMPVDVTSSAPKNRHRCDGL